MSVCVSEECEPSIWTLQKKNCLCLSLQVAVDGGELSIPDMVLNPQTIWHCTKIHLILKIFAIGQIAAFKIT